MTFGEKINILVFIGSDEIYCFFFSLSLKKFIKIYVAFVQLVDCEP